MLQRLCICALVPRLVTRTHLVLILHQTEARKPTNTGQLAARCLQNSQVIIRGAGNPADPGPLWPAHHQPLLLFPRANARPITDFASGATPYALIVPDGTWTQAARTCNRMASLKDIPAVHLPALPDEATTPILRLRTPRLPGQVSTMEAIARALEVLEGPQGDQVRDRLDFIYQLMVDRTLWARGRLTAAQISGGLPKETERS